MIVACPGCRQQMTVDPTFVGKQVQCPRCKQILSIAMPTAAPTTPDAVKVPAPAPIIEEVPKVRSDMRLTVELSCVVGLEDNAASNPEALQGPRWSETIRQIVIEVERPVKEFVDLPMTCKCCGKQLTLRVRSKPAVQDLFLWILFGSGGGLFFFALLNFAVGVSTAFAAVLCMVLALYGLIAISVGIWLAMNRPEKIDSIRWAVKIARDTRRDEEIQRLHARNQHGILSVERSGTPAP